MNTLPPLVSDHLTMSDLLSVLGDNGIELSATADSLTLKGVGEGLTEKHRQAIRDHKPELLTLCRLRDEFKRLHERVILMRVGNPPKGTRAEALAWLLRQVDPLAALCDQETGYSDPADPFAADALTVLRHEIEELTAGDYPNPLPEGCTLLPETNFSAFALGRLYNGKVI